MRPCLLPLVLLDLSLGLTSALARRFLFLPLLTAAVLESLSSIPEAFNEHLLCARHWEPRSELRTLFDHLQKPSDTPNVSVLPSSPFSPTDKTRPAHVFPDLGLRGFWFLMFLNVVRIAQDKKKRTDWCEELCPLYLHPIHRGWAQLLLSYQQSLCAAQRPCLGHSSSVSAAPAIAT